MGGKWKEYITGVLILAFFLMLIWQPWKDKKISIEAFPEHIQGKYLEVDSGTAMIIGDNSVLADTEYLEISWIEKYEYNNIYDLGQYRIYYSRDTLRLFQYYVSEKGDNRQEMHESAEIGIYVKQNE